MISESLAEEWDDEFRSFCQFSRIRNCEYILTFINYKDALNILIFLMILKGYHLS
jgi:hypothetical protein